jgi:N-acetylmuramoyl-L-alanine amidase
MTKQTLLEGGNISKQEQLKTLSTNTYHKKIAKEIEGSFDQFLP